MTVSTSARWVGIAAVALIALASAAPAVGQTGDSYVGEQVDPVSGYPCVTPFCDTVRLPGTDCLCQKQNPNEQRLQNLRFTCTDMTTRRQCSVDPNRR